MVGNVTRLRESNTAGGCKLQLVPVGLVDTVPPEYYGSIASAITLLSGNWTLVEPTRLTQEFAEAWQRPNGAQLAVASVAAVIPKDRVSLLHDLWHLHGDRYLVLVHDQNGTIKLMGTKEEPAIVRIEELTHGRDPRGDRNQYQLICTVSRRTACPFYLAVAPVVVGGLAPELPVDPDTVGRARVATTASINLASAPATIDGVTLAAGDRVLVKNQAAPAANGPYQWNGVGVPMTRALDYAVFDNLANGLIAVDQGTAYADTLWYCTSNAGGVLNTTAVTYVQFGGTTVGAFTDLTDVPGDYTGHGLKVVRVNAAETGLEFVAGGGGVTDHGALTGLGDDDHTQYHTDGRGDARYPQLSASYSNPAWITALAWAKLTGVPATFAPSAHTHPVADVSDMSANARTFNQSANYAAMRTALGLGSAAVENAATTTTANAVVKALGTGKIDVTFLPDSILGQLEYQGTWAAATNSPAIPAASTANKGWFYVASNSVAAGHGYANIPNVAYDTGDWIVSNGTSWDKVDNTDAVSTVFGRLGAIVAANGDYNAGQITNTPAGNIAAVTVQAALNELDAEKAALVHTHPVADVSDMSANARTFNQAANYAAMRTALGLGSAAVEGVSQTSAANRVVQALGTGKIDTSFLPDSVLGQLEYQGTWAAATNSPAIPAASTANKGWFYVASNSVAAGHGYANIPNIAYDTGDWIVSNGTSWDKVDNTDAVSTVFGRLGAIVAANGDYNAGQITNTPAGNIAAVTVQAALNELDAEKAALVHTHAQSDITGLVAALAAKQKTITSGTAAPSGGVDGDIYLQYT